MSLNLKKVFPPSKQFKRPTGHGSSPSSPVDGIGATKLTYISRACSTLREEMNTEFYMEGLVGRQHV
jgi:hypothetical protein